MNEQDRIDAAAAEATAQEAVDSADRAAQVFVEAVAQSMDELEERIVEVTGIKGNDDDAMIVGRVTFSPEVERVRRGMMPGPNGGCVREPGGPFNRPAPSLEELLDIFEKGSRPVPTDPPRREPVYVDADDLNEADKRSTGSAPPPEGTDEAARADGTNTVAKDSRTMQERAAYRPPVHVPLPPVPEGTAHQPKKTTPFKPALSRKDTNPKDAVGTQKWRQYCTVPTTIIWELGVAMLEGARKYGRHNYRIAGVRASVYVDAAKGHIDQWWEGEDIDVESNLNHIIKAIASLAVLRDAMIHNKWVDDRPPKTDLNTLRDDLQVAVDGIFERIPDAKDAYLEGDQYDDM